jgi:peptide/nickel transport system substrate-binding protein
LALAAGTLAAACTAGATAEAPTTSFLTTTSAPATTTTVPGTTTTQPAVATGGQVVIGVDQAPTTLNPYAAGGDSHVVALIGQAIHARAWDIDAATREVVPDVLTEIPTSGNGGVVVNPNGTMTVSYRIRDDANWSDGVPITGDDFAFTAETIAAIDDFRSDPFTGRNLYADITGFEAEVKTFTMTMRQTVGYETMFEWILPEHIVAGTDLRTDWETTIYPGAGPFVVASFIAGEQVTLARNPNYWKRDPLTGDALPRLDEVVFRHVPVIDDLLGEFAARRLDVIEPPPGNPAPDPAVVDEVVAGPIWEHISFQFGPGRLERNPLSRNSELAFRRAVAHAVDRVALAAANPTWAPISSYLDVGVPGLSTAAWDRYPYDTATARALLDEVRAEAGTDTVRAIFTTTSNSDERPRIAEVLAEMLGAVGIEYENQLEDSVLFFGDTLSEGSYDLGMWAWVADPTHLGLVGMLDLFDPGGTPPDGSNYYRWGTRDSSVRDDHSARFTEIRRLANATVDVDEVDRLVIEAEQLLADQMVVLPFAARAASLQWWGDTVTGLVNNPTRVGFTWNIEEWATAG